MPIRQQIRALGAIGILCSQALALLSDESAGSRAGVSILAPYSGWLSSASTMSARITLPFQKLSAVRAVRETRRPASQLCCAQCLLRHAQDAAQSLSLMRIPKYTVSHLRTLLSLSRADRFYTCFRTAHVYSRGTGAEIMTTGYCSPCGDDAYISRISAVLWRTSTVSRPSDRPLQAFWKLVFQGADIVTYRPPLMNLWWRMA